MDKHDVMILDCTLRDGGYINEWKWGELKAKQIINNVSKSGVDIIEIGFLRDNKVFSPDITVSDKIEDLNRYIPEKCTGTMYSAMAMHGGYDASKLSPYSGRGIELIRITAHEYDIDSIYDYAREIINKGYKVSINPINIMGYSDEQLLSIVKKVNEIYPYQFSIVDTFGSADRDSMLRIVYLIENNLDKGIRLGMHLHENMSLSYCMAQDLLAMHLKRGITIDGSLMGMGRSPGNLPLELICDFINNKMDYRYNIDELLDAIYDYIYPIRGKVTWGYTPEYFLSAKFNIHRNYAEHFLRKGDLTTRDVNHLLSRVEKNKAAVFDSEYANALYEEYKSNIIDDSTDLSKLKKELADRKILIVSPGNSISHYEKKIIEFINTDNPTIISVNFTPPAFECDYAFYSNNKRYNMSQCPCKIIATSNIRTDRKDYYINYNSISGAFKQGCNGFVMLLNLLNRLGIKEVYSIGADGYTLSNNYFDDSLRNYEQHGSDFNISVKRAVDGIGLKVLYLTPTKYGESLWN